MNQLVTWLEERELDIAAIYHTASLLFADDPDFARFLKTLAAQENDHGGFFHTIAESETSPSLEDLKQQFDAVTGDNMESVLRTARHRIADPRLDKTGMIELIIALEFSEWNSLFLYVMNWAGGKGRQFERMVMEIEQHRRTIEEYLLQQPDYEEYLTIIRNLAPLWQKRILILEDDEDMTRLLTIIMAPYGKLVVTHSGREALTRLRQKHFDAVISDVEMPGMNGIEFYRQAVTIDPAIGRHFLFLTGTTQSKALSFIKSTGARQLKKPTKIAKLREAVVGILNTA